MGIRDIENLTINDIKPIAISFKKNEDELILYKWILKHSGYSSFVKDTLRAIMENKSDTNTEFNQEPKILKSTSSKDKSSDLIELDF